MTLSQLNYVLAVAQHRHFGLAAESCFVTQPTLSMQIQKLEGELGAEIFDRSKQPIELTPLGGLIVEQARMVIGEAKKLESVVARTRDEISGPLRLGVIPTLAPSILPLFIAKFATQHPKLDITVEELQTRQIIERLNADSLDVGILVTPLFVPALIEHPVFQEPFLLYCAPGHSLLKSKKIVEGDLTAQEIWLLNEGHCFRGQALSLCSDSRKGRRASHKLKFESGNLETLKKMVDQGDGYTLLPWLAAADIADESKRKRLREFHAPAPAREVSVIHHKLYAKDAIVQSLIHGIKDNLPPEIARAKSDRIKTVPLL